MKQKKITYFWIGFFISTIVTAWLYWLWRKNRVITPVPLVISRRNTYHHEVDENDSLEERSDDLTLINGIGPATAGRLNGAGVQTYKQLSRLSSEQLETIVGSSRWDPEDWIEQARELAAQS